MKELDKNELMEIEGGIWWVAPALMLGIYLFDNREKFAQGVADSIKDYI